MVNIVSLRKGYNIMNIFCILTTTNLFLNHLYIYIQMLYDNITCRKNISPDSKESKNLEAFRFKNIIKIGIKYDSVVHAISFRYSVQGDNGRIHNRLSIRAVTDQTKTQKKTCVKWENRKEILS